MGKTNRVPVSVPNRVPVSVPRHLTTQKSSPRESEPSGFDRFRSPVGSVTDSGGMLREVRILGVRRCRRHHHGNARGGPGQDLVACISQREGNVRGPDTGKPLRRCVAVGLFPAPDHDRQPGEPRP